MRASLQLSILLSIFCIFSCKNPQEFLAGGSGWKEIVKANTNGEIVWRHSIGNGSECNSVAQLKDGNIIYSYKKGAKVVDENHKVIWEYNAPQGTELQSASETKEGNYLLGQCGNPTKIFEFTPKGKLAVEVSFDTGIKNPHAQTRKVSKTNKGTYLVPLFATRSVREYNKQGELVNEVKIGGNPFCAKELKNGNWLVGCGDAHRLIEINPQTKEIVWEVKQNDIKGARLAFVAELIPLDNGNVIVCNWTGHDKNGAKTPKLFEINRDKQLIWKLEEKSEFGKISTAFQL
jgi:hypothetical protein